MHTSPLPEGFRLLPGYFDRNAQENLLKTIRGIVAAAQLYQPVMPRTAKPFSVRMTNCGTLGWVSDVNGYRYQERHPVSGEKWPDIPAVLLDLWRSVAPAAGSPQACLVNFYEAGAKMGLHQDRDEEDFGAPVVSVSLGDTGVFRLGGTDRRDPTRSFKLASGDVVVLGGEARLAFHGIDRIIARSSTLLPKGGRINLTLRRVTAEN